MITISSLTVTLFLSVTFTLSGLFYLYFTFFSSWSNKTIKNEVVLITGGANGLGLELALQLTSQVKAVVVWDIDNVGLEKIKNQVALVQTVDVSNINELEEALEVLQKQVGDVTIVINNAAVLSAERVDNLTRTQIETSFKVNVLAPFSICKFFIPKMKKMNHGHIVNISSVLGGISIRKLSDYCATKAALSSFHEAMSIELMDYDGISTTLCCTATIDTRMFAEATNVFFSPLKAEYVSKRIIADLLLGNKTMNTLIIPRLFYTLPFYQILPIWIKCFLIKLIGANADNVRGSNGIQKNKIKKK